MTTHPPTRRHDRRIVAILAAALASASVVAAGELPFVGHLQGSQEVPPVVSSASGTALVTVNDARTEIAFELQVEGIDLATTTAAHIHVAVPGVNGPVIFSLSAGPITSPLSGTLTEADLVPHPEVGVSTFADAIAKLLAGAAYVNVHSAANPGGEIRGQLGLIIEIDGRTNVNPKSKGVIPITIVSTEDFDARSIDPNSVRFGPGGAQEAHHRGHGGDADGDGRSDLVLHFRTRASGIACGDTYADLSGFTSTGLRFEARLAVRTVGCNGRGRGPRH
jgi:hypothetical protein